jgi:hypothetical protein
MFIANMPDAYLQSDYKLSSAVCDSYWLDLRPELFKYIQRKWNLLKCFKGWHCSGKTHPIRLYLGGGYIEEGKNL